MTALLLALSLAAPVPKEIKKADDTTTLLGKWETVTADYSGKPGMTGAVFRFDADGAGGVTPPMTPTEISAKYTLDSTSNPKRFEWALGSGGKSIGTYELNGDVLKVAFGSNGKQPANAAPGADVSFYEMKRVKPEK